MGLNYEPLINIHPSIKSQLVDGVHYIDKAYSEIAQTISNFICEQMRHIKYKNLPLWKPNKVLLPISYTDTSRTSTSQLAPPG